MVAAMAVEHGESGTWRKGEFVLWSDALVPIPATLIWLALAIVAGAVALPILQRNGVTGITFANLPALMRQPVALQLLTVSSDLVLLFFVWRIARRVTDSALVARFRAVRRPLLVLSAVGGAALAVGTLLGSAYLVSSHLVVFHPAPGEQLVVPGAPWQYAVGFLTVGVVAPLVEESYFRGILLSWLGRKITWIPAALVSAAVFALLHFRFSSHPGAEGWLLTATIAVVGLVNAALAIRTRSLWPPVLFHAGYNSTLFALAMLSLALR
jgi:membrane protease YdiL (CAAX protease family)